MPRDTSSRDHKRADAEPTFTSGDNIRVFIIRGDDQPDAGGKKKGLSDKTRGKELIRTGD